MSDTLKAHLALSLVAIIYGLNYVIAKDVLSLNYMTPSAFILLRALSGAVFFFAVHRLFIQEKMEVRDIGYTAFCSIFGVAINMLCFFEGLKFTSPIHASLIMITTPILVLIVSAIIIKEKITWPKGVAILLGFIGSALLISGEDNHASGASTYGDLMIFINAASYGIYLVIVRKLLRKYHPFTVIKWLFLFGTILLFPFGFQDLQSTNWELFPTSIWWAVAYVLIATTFITYLSNAYALSKVMPSTVGFYIYFQPLIASIAAISLGKDHLTPTMIIAAVLLFTGVYIANSRRKQVRTT